MVKLTHGTGARREGGGPGPAPLLGVSLPSLPRWGAVCPGCSPPALLTGTALPSEGVPRGKDVLLKRKPDGLINFRVFFFFFNTVGWAPGLGLLEM